MGDWDDWLVSTGQVKPKGQSNNNAKAEAEAAAKAQAAAQAAAAKRARDAAAAKAKADAAASAKRQAEARKRSDDMMNKAMTDPNSLVTKAKVEKVDPNAAGTNIAAGTGQMKGVDPISAPKATEANIYDATQSEKDAREEANKLTAAKGNITSDSTVDAAQMDTNDLAQLDLEADQIASAQRVEQIEKRKVEQGEMISGSAVDLERLNKEALDVQAAQATPTEKATVKGQLSELMTDFDGGKTPAWAAGAMRAATAQMAARGLSGSSMAAQATVQAAMEAALPIASQDAQTNASFEAANLSNRQQTAMFAAEQRASFLGMEFTQEFQTRVTNAAKISDIANMNFTAEQQVALENAKMAQSVDLANLGANNALILSDAAAMSQMDLSNLNNRQQARVTNAQAFLAMDMKNVDNEQQTNIFKTQKKIDSIFSDQAADNAAKQFNASSQNQTDQFFANLQTDVNKFNAGMEVQTQQFNAQNALVVAQANAQWRQNATLANTAAQNAANMQAAQAANDMTQSAMDAVWQRERDIMDQSFRQAENAEDRALTVFMGDKNAALQFGLQESAQDAQKKSDKAFSWTMGAYQAFKGLTG